MDETLSFIEFIEQGGKDSQDEYEREGGSFPTPPSPPTVRPRIRRRSAGCEKLCWSVWFVLYVRLIWFIWLVSFNQTNETNQTNQITGTSYF